MSESRPYFSFLNSYLVATGSDSTVIGVVRKEGRGWQAIRLGVAEDEQPLRRFVTRQDAAEHLLELSSPARQ